MTVVISKIEYIGSDNSSETNLIFQIYNMVDTTQLSNFLYIIMTCRRYLNIDIKTMSTHLTTKHKTLIFYDKILRSLGSSSSSSSSTRANAHSFTLI